MFPLCFSLFCSSESSLQMALESRGSTSFGSQPMDCNSFNPIYPDSGFTLHASCRCDLLLISSTIGDLKESDFCRDVVGANQSVTNEMACVNINPTIGSPVLPDMESKQKVDSIAGGGESSVTRCNEELDPEGSACCLEVANFNPVEGLHGLESKLQIKSAGSEMRPSEGSSTHPMHQAELMDGINPVAQGVMVECPLEVSHRGMIQLPFGREDDVTGCKASSGLPTENAGGMTGAS